MGCLLLPALKVREPIAIAGHSRAAPMLTTGSFLLEAFFVCAATDS